jgi:hypothetical protein
MLLINEITDEPRQQHLLTVDGYGYATLLLEWRPEQYGWFFTLSWGTFQTTNERVTASQNILRQYQNILPFGVAVNTTNLQDPMTQDAFLTGVASLYLLNADDAAYVETARYG